MADRINFDTTVYGKWILCGEHSVLRGTPALVFPLKSRSLQLKFYEAQVEQRNAKESHGVDGGNKAAGRSNDDQEKKAEGLELELGGNFGEEFRLLFWGVLERAFEFKKLRRSDVHGKIVLNCDIPIGAGLGASASLCSAVTRWLIQRGAVSNVEALEFARQLENLFHGESSGVDVAVALSSEAIRYVRNQEISPIKPLFSPNWYISYSGKRGVTADCVRKVKDLIESHRALGAEIDLDMQMATELCEEALLSPQLTEGVREMKLAQGIQLGRKCFERWGLTEGPLDQHMQMLKENGALATKPTGSGQGGYVLSLWKSDPPESLRETLISCALS